MRNWIWLGCALSAAAASLYLVGCAKGPPVNLGDKARLQMETQADGKQASIGLRLLELNSDADYTGPEAEQAAVTVEILDQQGKVVSSETGDLEKFGFS
jgi:hypothetical protein